MRLQGAGRAKAEGRRQKVSRKGAKTPKSGGAESCGDIRVVEIPGHIEGSRRGEIEVTVVCKNCREIGEFWFFSVT